MKLVLSPATRSVLPTATDILTVDVTEWQQLTVEVKNLDGSQTVAVEIWRLAPSPSSSRQSDAPTSSSTP